jgi:hypothetical protein
MPDWLVKILRAQEHCSVVVFNEDGFVYFWVLRDFKTLLEASTFGRLLTFGDNYYAWCSLGIPV